MLISKIFSKRTIITAIMLIIFAALIYVFAFTVLEKPIPYMTQDEYMNTFGIRNMCSYDSIKLAKKAELIDEAVNAEGWITLIFDGYQIEFRPDKILANIMITSPDYSLGQLEIGIGSTAEDVMNAYKNQKKVNDTRQNEIGYIDGPEGNASDDSLNPWIFFELNERTRVERIIICPLGI